MNEMLEHDAAPEEPGRFAQLASKIMRSTVWWQGEQQPLDPLDAELAALDGAIPQSLDDYALDTGRRYERQKTFEPATTRRAMDKVFDGEFSEHAPALKAASIQLFGKLRITAPRDTAPLGRIDSFLAGFPRNITDQLSQESKAETLLAILETGSALIDASSSMPGSTDMLDADKGVTALLLAHQIPQLVEKQGVECLANIKAVAQEHHTSDVQSYVSFSLNQEAAIGSLGFTAQDKLGVVAPRSPFIQEDDTRAWQKAGSIGLEKRAPVWLIWQRWPVLTTDGIGNTA